ncbi:MAG: chorismate dehydratase [Pyrinomonadaceae bacterium]|jgi:chorismate dehydratase|nr:chorismate dehydratase [Pyrinomonadaceae bacterium]
MNSKTKPRLAASNYLNTAPLIWSFKHGARKDEADLVEALPSACADLLARHEVDFALVPAIEYQRIEDATLVPGVCVGSRQKVRSVVLVSRLNNLKKVRTVALDDSSRTSAALVKIIFKEFLGLEPKWTTRSPELKQMLRDNDAALIIGDPAMTFPRDGLHVWDLAALWHDFTGRGFVFAMWMAEKTSAAPAIDFREATEEGLAQRNEIIDSYEQSLGLSRSELESYLTENITFFLDDDLRKGLQLYYDLAYKHKLIPGLKPLNL